VPPGVKIRILYAEPAERPAESRPKRKDLSLLPILVAENPSAFLLPGKEREGYGVLPFEVHELSDIKLLTNRN